jgi:hypothetical protein
MQLLIIICESKDVDHSIQINQMGPDSPDLHPNTCAKQNKTRIKLYVLNIVFNFNVARAPPTHTQYACICACINICAWLQLT